MLNWDDYNVAEGEAPVAAPQQQAPVQPEVVNKTLETLNEQPAVAAPATDSVKAAAEVFWRMAKTVAESLLPADPSGSKARRVSLPFCWRERKPEEKGLEPS